MQPTTIGNDFSLEMLGVDENEAVSIRQQLQYLGAIRNYQQFFPKSEKFYPIHEVLLACIYGLLKVSDQRKAKEIVQKIQQESQQQQQQQQEEQQQKADKKEKQQEEQKKEQEKQESQKGEGKGDGKPEQGDGDGEAGGDPQKGNGEGNSQGEPQQGKDGGGGNGGGSGEGEGKEQPQGTKSEGLGDKSEQQGAQGKARTHEQGQQKVNQQKRESASGGGGSVDWSAALDSLLGSKEVPEYSSGVIPSGGLKPHLVNLAPLKQAIRTSFTTLAMSKEKRNQREGSFDSRKVTKAFIGSQRVFRSREKGVRNKVAVCTMMDHSGSMDSWSSNKLRQYESQWIGAELIRRALDQLRIPNAFYAFDDGVGCVKGWREHGEIRLHRTQGGTNFINGMNHAINELSRRAESRKIAILWTDGDTSIPVFANSADGSLESYKENKKRSSPSVESDFERSKQRTNKILQKAKKKGIEVVVVYLIPEAVKNRGLQQFFTNWIGCHEEVFGKGRAHIVSNPAKELPAIMRKTLLKDEQALLTDGIKRIK